jgi:hypothetical protein
MEIKILRLKNGEDIVGQITTKDDDTFDVLEPMTVGIDFRGREAGLVMQHWLPVQLIKKNEVNISNNDVLCFIEPDNNFCEYYVNTIEKIHELLKAKNLVNNFSDEEINNMMDAFDELQDVGHTLH